MIDLKNVDRIWFISDIHFGVRGNSLDWVDIHKQFFNDFLFPLLKEESNKNDIVFLLGDIFENRQTINVLVQNVGIELISELSSRLPIYSLIGNHDIYFKNTNEVNSLRILSPYMRKIFESPEVMKIGGVKFGIVPWIENKDNEKSVLVDMANQGCEYILGHTVLKDFRFNKYRNTDAGFDIKELPNTVKGIVSGHIHMRQMNENGVYIGSPLSFNRGDVDNIKGIYRLDINSNKFDFFENKISPKFLNINYEDVKNTPLSEFNELVKGNFVDFLIPENLSEQFPIQRMIDLVDGVAKDVTLGLVNENTIAMDFFSEETDEDDDYNVMQLMKEYIIQKIDDKDLRKQIFREIKQLFKEAEALYNENNLD